jgi:hypothetical protein
VNATSGTDAIRPGINAMPYDVTIVRTSATPTAVVKANTTLGRTGCDRNFDVTVFWQLAQP